MGPHRARLAVNCKADEPAMHGPDPRTTISVVCELEFQRQRIPNRAIEVVVRRVRIAGRSRFLHAFPAFDNEPANAICRAAGFVLMGEVEFNDPVGHTMRQNDRRL